MLSLLYLKKVPEHGLEIFYVKNCYNLCVCVSESSMYLPVTPVMNKHRKSLNLLEVPYSQHAPHVKQQKVKIADLSNRVSNVISAMTSLRRFFFWQPHSTADLHLPRDSQGNTDFAALVRQLKECPTLQDQADILYVLYIMKYAIRDKAIIKKSTLNNVLFVTACVCSLEPEERTGRWSY